MSGAWSKHNGLTPENVHALATYNASVALRKIIGVSHRSTGIYYTQVVSGQINYAFASESAPVVLDPKYSPEWIYTEVTFDGRISPARIEANGPTAGGAFGGWTEHNGLTVENVDALRVYQTAIALDGKIGVQHHTTGVYFKQLVNGTNYAFASETGAVIPNPSFTPEWVYTYESLKGEVEPAKFEKHPPIPLEASV